MPHPTPYFVLYFSTFRKRTPPVSGQLCLVLTVPIYGRFDCIVRGYLCLECTQSHFSLILFFLQDSPDSVVNLAPASTAATQVRVIMRDMSGKNVWDYTLLHGSSSADNEQYQYSGKIMKISKDSRPLSISLIASCLEDINNRDE